MLGLGMLGAKAIFGGILAIGVASCGAYVVHTLKAAGANEVGVQVTQQTLQAQDAEIKQQKKDTARLAGINAKLKTDAEDRADALRIALTALQAPKATEQCPENCLLQQPSS